MSNIHALFVRDLCRFVRDLRDEGNHVVLGMNTKDDIQDGDVTNIRIIIVNIDIQYLYED